MIKYAITDKEWESVLNKVQTLEKENQRLTGVIEGMQSEQLCQHKYQDVRYGTSRCVICGEEEQSFQAQLRTTPYNVN